MIQAILNFFGLGKKEETSQPLTEGSTLSSVKTQPERPQPPARPPIKKTSIRAKNYYRRKGNYYSSSDDSLIEDLMLLVVLNELFSDGDIREIDESIPYSVSEPVEDLPADDLLDIDVSDTPVVESVREEVNWSVDVPADNTPEAATYTPVRQESYSSGYSDSDSSSSYDSGSSDSGGGSDD